MVALIVGCAQQVAPTGGPKDIEPPGIIDEQPASGTTSFQEKEVVITFNEFVKLERLKEQLVASPPLKYNLNASIRGKRLKLKIKDTLKEATTYVFNFGNAIVDIRENNPIENYTYVLSTGTSIDSGTIGGRVIRSFEAEPAEKVAIMAYSIEKDNIDSLPYIEKPDYIAVSNKEGLFKLEYMKEGKYKLFALLDENDNYLFDKKTEKIAFIEEPIDASAGIDSLQFYLFEEDHEIQYVKDQKETGPSTLLNFNLEVDSFSYSMELIDSIDQQPLLADYQLPDDSVFIWWPNRKLRFPVIINADTLRDTLKLLTDTIVYGRRSPLRIIEFGPHTYFSNPRLVFSFPIVSIDTQKIVLLNKDSVLIPFRIKKGKRANLFYLEYSKTEGMKYTLSIDSAAFIDIYGYANDSIGFTNTLDEEADYGSLKVDIAQEYKGPLILQLTTGQRKFIKEVALEQPSYTFEHLKSGTFSLKLILDENGNGKWDTGDYLEGIQPEKVINYQGEIRIRSRWAKEVDWIIE